MWKRRWRWRWRRWKVIAWACLIVNWYFPNVTHGYIRKPTASGTRYTFNYVIVSGGGSPFPDGKNRLRLPIHFIVYFKCVLTNCRLSNLPFVFARQRIETRDEGEERQKPEIGWQMKRNLAGHSKTVEDEFGPTYSSHSQLIVSPLSISITSFIGWGVQFVG